MSIALLILGCALPLLAFNALRPLYRGPLPLVALAFFAGWWTIELAPHLLAVAAMSVGGLVLAGAVDGPAGWTGLTLAVLGLGLLAVLALEARRTAATLRECGVPPEPDGDVPYPRSHLVIPPLCLRPRRGVRVDRGVVFREIEGLRLRADVYRSAADAAGEGPRPGLMQIHGGGWIIGDKREQGLPLLNHMALLGWAGFNVNYRLSPRATFPEHLDDLKHFIAWYREHAHEYDADPDFLCVTGGSAGGHLAALIALTAGDPDFQAGLDGVDTSVRAAVPFYGVYDMVEDGPWPVPFGSIRFMQRMVFKTSFAADPEPFRRASPITHVGPDAPPFLVVQGGRDTIVPAAEARRFVAALREASRAPVLYAEIEGGQHGFDVFPSYRSARVVEGVGRYLTGIHRAYTAGGSADHEAARAPEDVG